MATTSATSSRLHPTLQQGLRDGSVARMKIGDKYFLVYKVQDGALTRSAFSPTANVEKIKQVAQLTLNTHKAIAATIESLQGKEIIQITNAGARYEGNSRYSGHSRARVTGAEDYLRATDDFAWRAPALALNEKLNGLTDRVATLPATELPPEFRAYLHQKGPVQPNYPVHSDATSGTIGLKDHLLDFTREKIKHTYAVHAQVNEDVTPRKTHEWTMAFTSVEEAIGTSNDFIKDRFTAQHVWQTLMNLTNDTPPEIYQAPLPVIPSDEEDVGLPSPAISRRDSVGGMVDPRPVVARDLMPPVSPRGRKRIRSLSPPPRRRSEDLGVDELRGRGRTRTRFVSSGSSRSPSRSPSRERSLSPAPTLRHSRGGSPFLRVPVRRGEDPLTAVESGSSRTATRIRFRAPTESQPRKQYMSEEDSRLTRAYRDLLPQINGPVLVGPKDFRGAYAKFQRFKEDHGREGFEPLSQAELLAVREAHDKVMQIPDYKRHADLEDAAYFHAILYQLKIKR